MNLRKSVEWPLGFLLVMCLVEALRRLLAPELFGKASLAVFGIFPRQVDSLPGVLLAPFIHVDGGHFMMNAVPLVILGVAVFLFYPRIGKQVFVFSLLMTGLGVWLFARDHRVPHVGASGVVYSLAGFLFLSGLFRRDVQSLVVSLLIAFLDVTFYGTATIEGMLPSVASNISWESHLIGGVVGGICAFYYRAVPSTVTRKRPDPPAEGEGGQDGFRNLETDAFAYRYRASNPPEGPPDE